jgi:carboxyl-terminal processing protease
VWRRPLVALVDGGTRSAKEVIADRLLEMTAAVVVGEQTAGAVIPATFEEVGGGAVLMFPSTRLGAYTEKLEGVGVSPDVEVRDRLPFSAGADPILEEGTRVLRELCGVGAAGR